MKKIFGNLILYCVIIMLTLPFMYFDCDCNKSTPTISSSMYWVYQGNTIYASYDTAFLSANTIDGYFVGTTSTAKQHVEVSLQGSNLNIGTYTVGGGPNSVYIWLGTNSALGATSGQVIISTKTPGWINGTFDVMLSNGQHLTGTMVQVEID